MSAIGPRPYFDDHLDRERLIHTGTGIVMELLDTSAPAAFQLLSDGAHDACVEVEQAASFLIALCSAPRD